VSPTTRILVRKLPKIASFVAGTIQRHCRRSNNTFRLTCIRIPDHSKKSHSPSHFSLTISDCFSLFLSILSSSTSIHTFANIFASFVYQHIDTLPFHHTTTPTHTISEQQRSLILQQTQSTPRESTKTSNHV
jgi:uncharacterized protein YktB (UPF0637 family)